MKTVLWILGLAGGWVGLGFLLGLPRERRLRRLAASRGAEDAFVPFRQSFPDVPEGLLRRVYTAVQGLVAEQFPVRGDDNLWITLEVDEGSIDGLFEEILAKKDHGAIPTLLTNSSIGTVGDLVRLVWRVEQNGARETQRQPAP
jgi:hypothetical protein